MNVKRKSIKFSKIIATIIVTVITGIVSIGGIQNVSAQEVTPYVRTVKGSQLMIYAESTTGMPSNDELWNCLAKQYPMTMESHPPINYIYTVSKGVYRGGIALAKTQDFADNEKNIPTWIATNVPKIIPAGTPMEQIPIIATQYTANIMSYDYNLANNTPDIEKRAEFAWKGITTGKGTCSTYTAVNNTIIRFTPVNPATNKVDYTCKNPMFLPVRSVCNGAHTHAWTAVFYNNTWHHFDATNYNASINKLKYLNMNSQELKESMYSNYFFL